MNLSTIDRTVRASVGALALIIIFSTGTGTIAAQNIIGIIGSVLLLTALIGFCPFYFLFRFSTKEKPKKLGKNKGQKSSHYPQLYK